MDIHKTIIISTPVSKYSAKVRSLNESYGSPSSRVLTANSIRKNCSVTTKSTPVTCISTMEKIPLPEMLNGNNGTVAVPNRKRRLDHLSFEEKLHRKKLKNRMAAQVSRDRKKAKMGELESEVKELKSKNAVLMKQCENLQSQKQKLMEENKELRRKLVESQTSSVSCSPSVVGPAASNIDPLLQGQGLQLALGLVMMVLLSHHFQNCLEIWKEKTALPNSANLPIAGFEKLLMSWMKSRVQKERLQLDPERRNLLKWWGRHQKTWNPVGNYLWTPDVLL